MRKRNTKKFAQIRQGITLTFREREYIYIGKNIPKFAIRYKYYLYSFKINNNASNFSQRRYIRSFVKSLEHYRIFVKSIPLSCNIMILTNLYVLTYWHIDSNNYVSIEHYTIHQQRVMLIQLCSVSSNQFHPDPAGKQSQKPVWHIHIALCTVLDSWWWTEKLSGKCRVLLQK